MKKVLIVGGGGMGLTASASSKISKALGEEVVILDAEDKTPIGANKKDESIDLIVVSDTMHELDRNTNKLLEVAKVATLSFDELSITIKDLEKNRPKKQTHKRPYKYHS